MLKKILENICHNKQKPKTQTYIKSIIGLYLHTIECINLQVQVKWLNLINILLNKRSKTKKYIQHNSMYITFESGPNSITLFWDVHMSGRRLMEWIVT